MAIMERCLCFSNVRRGSVACGIYSLISACIYLAVWAYNLAEAITTVQGLGLTGPAIRGLYAAYSIDIIVALFLIIASIVLLVGVPRDNKDMLIPYMIAITTLVALQAIGWIIIFVLFGLETVFLISNLAVWVPFTALNIVCLLCVISQYQELREGRGRAINYSV